MRKLLYISLLSSIILCMHGCGGNGSTALTKKQQDSIVAARADSIRIADSIAAIEKAKADSIARINAKKKESRKFQKISARRRTNLATMHGLNIRLQLHIETETQFISHFKRITTGMCRTYGLSFNMKPMIGYLSVI